MELGRAVARRRVLLMVSLVLSASAGCTDAPSPPAGAVETRDLEDHTFELASVDIDGAPSLLVETERPISVAFADGHLSAVDGCNSYSADYQLVDEALVLGDPNVSQVSCGSAIDAQARRLTEALEARPIVTRSSEGIDLSHGGVEIRLRRTGPSAEPAE